jgi:cob(I)alamin adenosyltransferase
MPIYTRTGDDGTTAVFGGRRLSKADAQVEAYGSIDELNSMLGVVIAQLPKTTKLREFFVSVQQDLMMIGSVLAGWGGDISPLKKRVKIMEKYMDDFGEKLPTLHNFILPGGSTTGAFLHVTRSVCQRTERTIVRLTKEQKHYKIIAMYLNRLSDLFFVYARVINKADGFAEQSWFGISSQKGKRKVV